MCCTCAQDYDPRWVEAFDMIRDGVFGDAEYFKDLVDSVNDVPKSGNDWFLVANDFSSYMDAQVSAETLRKLLLGFSVYCGGAFVLACSLLPALHLCSSRPVHL